MDDTTNQQLETREEIVSPKRNIPVFIIATILFVIISLILLFALSFNSTVLTIILILVLAFYISIASFLLEPKIIRDILRTITKIEEKPIIREIEKKVFIEKPIIREIEKKVFIEKPVYIQMPREKLDIPKYDYLGSSQAKTYHSRNCRLARLIKRKYKVSNNSQSFFKKRGYSACSVCIKK